MYKNCFKRVFDFMLSLFAVIVLSPLLLVLIILIRLNLGSPVFFKQQRPGKNGEIFNMIKFRTMKDAQEISTGRKLTDAERLILIKEKGEDAVTSDSQRLTKLGALLRKLSLDELPELFNILKGAGVIIGTTERYLDFTRVSAA